VSSSALGLPQDPAALLYDAFSAKCESQGPFTARALRETNAMSNVIETLLNDSECKKGFAPLVQNISTLNNELAFLNDGFENEPRKALEEYASTISVYLATQPGTVDASSLSLELTNAQIQLLKYKSQRDELRRASQARAIQNLSQYVNGLAEVYPNMSLCFERHQTLPIQLASHLMELSGGFFGPVANAASVLAGRLFSSVFNYFNDMKFVSAIKKFRGTKLQTGLACAAEALEQTVCDIQDRRELLRLHENYRKETSLPVEWQGYNLLERQYPIVQQCLLRIEAGADPQSDLQGSKRSDFRKMEGNYRATIEKCNGLIGETERKIQLLTARNAGKDAVQQLTQNLIDLLLGNIFEGGSNIYSSIVPSIEGYQRMAIWLREGSPNPNISSIKVSGPYSQYLSDISSRDLDVQNIKTHLQSIHDSAKAQLDVLRTLVLNPDAQGAISSCFKRTTNLPSAEEVMAEFLNYLRTLQESWIQHPEWFSNRYTQQDQIGLAAKVAERFENTLKALHDNQSYPDKIKAIYLAMNLQEQDQILEGNLRSIVETDLLSHLKAGFLQGSPQLENSIRLANEEIFSALFPGETNLLKKAKNDLHTGEIIAKSNLKNFYDFFRKSLERALDDLKDQGSLWKDEAHHDQIAKLCVLILNAPQLNTKDFRSIVRKCSGAALVEKVQSGELSVSFDQALKKYAEEPEKKLCSYRRFRNQIDLAETLEQRSSK
jgi:hypothetical protein